VPEPNLHSEGWRQGSLIAAALHTLTLDADDAGRLTSKEQEFDMWMLCSQDCDLANTGTTNATREFELRPVYHHTGKKVDGIRSRVARVTNDRVLNSDSPRLTLTARALQALLPSRLDNVGDTRRRELKTWLGLRYDRPAVPEAFVETQKTLAGVFFAGVPADLDGMLRDILIYYESASEIRVFAVLKPNADREVVIDWLDAVIQGLSERHQIAVIERNAEPAARTPLLVIETYFGLDSAELSSTSEEP
jgi:hypothetical protein